MTLKHIQDQIENYGLQVARQAFLAGLKEARNKKTNIDDVHDLLDKIVKETLLKE